LGPPEFTALLDQLVLNFFGGGLRVAAVEDLAKLDVEPALLHP